MEKLYQNSFSKEELYQMKRDKNIKILDDTLKIVEKGSYIKDGSEIKLRFSYKDMAQAEVFLPEDIEKLRLTTLMTQRKDECHDASSSCDFSCENIDTFSLADKRLSKLKRKGSSDSRVLVLNLASAKNPGGGVRKGSSAQEEDLCRKSSLLISLEGDRAREYYSYNRALKTHMGSHAIIISPNVEVIKGSDSCTLDDPFEVGVMTCSAPNIRSGLEGMTQREYRELLKKRIDVMLRVAALKEYHHLILGAFGCGVFGNDAAQVSDLFRLTINDFCYNGKSADDLFDSIEFAVLCRKNDDYNYKQFARNFSNNK